MIYETPWEKPPLEQCSFYTSMAFPSGLKVAGEWDFEDNLDAYTGGQDWTGKTVLDVGAASGAVSFYLESRGAQVTSLDVAEGSTWELIPYHGSSPDLPVWLEAVRMLKNSYWFGWHEHASKCQVAYCDIYNIPQAEFTHAVVGSILLHLSRPFDALRSIASRVTETIVVSDMHRALTPGMMFAPALGYPDNLCAWWYVSHEQASRMLQVLGFEVTSLNIFTLQSVRHSTLSPFYTLVARRK